MTLTANTQPRLCDRRLHAAQPDGTARHRALIRLYERRSSVDHLIQALERYQLEQGASSRTSLTEASGWGK